LHHRLANHSLFDLARLAELAISLPPASVEYNAGDLPISVDPLKTPHTGLSIEETVRRIEQCRSWMVLKNVEQDPEYRELLLDCLREIEQHGGDRCGGVAKREAFVFISSPGAVTPYHMDPEWNFLLQVRGYKSFTVYPSDPDIVSEEELERFHSGAHRNMVFRPEYDRKAMRFELTPGDGVHVPVTSPHWVKVGNEVSISFSVTFQTRELERRATLYALNHRQRQRGGKPRPIGLSPWRDSLRYNWYRVGRRLKWLVGIGRAQASAAMKTRM
jgi:cupin-like protein